MPIPNLCSHISNSFRAGLRRTAVPATKLNRAVCGILYREGFVSAVLQGDVHGPDPSGHEVPITPDNIALRRLWLELKYRDNEPVLRNMKAISLPSRRVYATVDELKAVAAGRRNAHALMKPADVGQITILDTAFGVLDMNEALLKSVGGEVLAIVK